VPGLEVAPLDSAAVLRRRDEVIHNLDDSSHLPWLEQHGVTLVRGRGRISGELTVDVEGQEPLRARRAVVVATGSTPLIPDIPGLRDAEPWTSREATTAQAAPGSLAILGGGVVAVEMAQAWGALGSRVTLIHRGERVIAREEPFASDQVLNGLRELGVDVRLGVSATRVARDGAFSLALDDGSSVEADELLVAAGRNPGTSGIGLEELGLPTDRPLRIGDDLRVPGHAWLFAVGDVNGRVQLTHMGKYQGRLVADAILGREVRLRSDGDRSPRVIFTDPQVAAVGLTLAAAQAEGLRVRHVDVETSGNAGGSFIGHGAPGTSRIVVDEQRRIIIGATITGAEVAEALHAATIAVVSEIDLDDLWHAVPSFPTRSELWLRLLEAYGL
jgi:dihydrolipoamide dehydrogenase